MSSEVTVSSDVKQIKTTSYKTNRKIYNREELFRYYYCTQETPDYLKEFQYLYNNFTEDNWCKKPIPKFEVAETKSKTVYNPKFKARQRTLSNQSGDNTVDFSENYSKQRSYTGSNGKSNRYGSSPKEMRSTEDIKSEANNKFINTDDFVDNNEAQWHKVEPRTIRSFNSSKPYAQNIHLTENHWKKWTKDTNQIGDKNRPQNTTVGRQERGNNIWTRKNEGEARQKNTRSYGRHSVSRSGDQTEDIWQDDWDTEMKSEIAKETDDLLLDSYEFPKSSVLPVTPPPMELEQKSPIFDKPPESPNSRYEYWYYRDLSDIERGPFSSENMANWLATGYFNPSTFVRRSCDERFLLLAEYRALYGRIPFTAGPTIPTIHINTPIEIDVKQLLIGVEMNLIQKVISCATTLPSIGQPPILQNNSMRIDDGIQIATNATEMMAIIEEKRILEESRLELERERERMVQEQEQWRERMQAEFKAKMEEIKLEKSLIIATNVEKSESTVEFKAPTESPVILEDPISKPQPVVEIVAEQKEPEILTPKLDINTQSSTDKWEIDAEKMPQVLSSTENNLWFSKKDIKHKKQNKKSKTQENKSTKEEKEVVQIPEAKQPEQPTDSRISFISKEAMNKVKKENVENKGRPIKIELDIHKTDSTAMWNTLPNSNNSASQVLTKSLLEIQAEEFEKEKIEKESKMDENENKVKPVKVDPSTRKNDMPSSWIQSPLSPSSNLPTMTKSLLEIQAEESAKEKRQQEMQNITMAHALEANKVSSFKESLLKSSKLSKQPAIPVGKSIWDMIPTESPVSKPVQTPEPVVKKNVEVKSSKDDVKGSTAKKTDIESDQLTDWCVKKLVKFSDKFDVHTVIELLKQVPNEEVMELALQLLDDSKFTSTFVVEYINKRQDLSDRQTEDSWHTVKKPITTTIVNTTASKGGKGAKSKSKKKMVVVDTKFR